ncbi:MAG TPA: hypothetical protein VLV78_07845 [Thermoanaerobaculia bacterium]|nr:hypothetical protein [Thermoanaerobaculia bacterium]
MGYAIPLIVAALGFLSAATTQPPIAPRSLEVQINIAPSILDPLQLLRRSTPNTYTCDAVVLDDEKHAVIGLAKVVAEPGRRETAKRVNGETEVEFGVLIAPAGDRADTKVTVRRSGVVVVRQSATIRLINVSGKKYVPLQ